MKDDVFDLHMQVKLSCTYGLQDTQDMKSLMLSCPLLYYSAHGDYELIETTQELADVFHYMDNNENHHVLIKQLG